MEPEPETAVTTVPQLELAPPQRDRLERFGVEQCADVHCHCLPGLDDGPATVQGAVALCKALVADGVTTAVATPHQLGRYDLRNGAADVRGAVAKLRQVLAQERVPLAVLPGADVRVDERLPQLLSSGHVLTLADNGRHVLLELPHETYIEPLPLIRLLVARGLYPVVSHPERHEHVAKRPELSVPWLQNGAALQVTSGSLAGDFGPSAERCAWDLLTKGAAAIVASDAHGATRRPPRMTAAIDLIEQRLGRDEARRVCLQNPAKIVAAAAAVAPKAARQGEVGNGDVAGGSQRGWGAKGGGERGWGRRGKPETGTDESMVQHRVG